MLLCEIESAYTNMPQSVAVRSRPPTSKSTSPTQGQPDKDEREEFLRECRLLASLDHSHVVKLVGVSMSSEADPYCAIFEHSLQVNEDESLTAECLITLT